MITGLIAFFDCLRIELKLKSRSSRAQPFRSANRGRIVAKTETRELRLDRRHASDYYPCNARFNAGLTVGEPARNEVFIEEPRVDYPAIRNHLATVPHTMFGRYEREVRDFRTSRRRIGLRVVFEDDAEAVFFKMAWG